MTVAEPLDMIVHTPGVVPMPGGAMAREAIVALEQAIRDMPGQVDIPSQTFHHFAPGIYCREYRMVPGEVVVGKIHKHAHFAMLMSGRATIVDEFDRVEMTAPFMWLSKPGAKRAVYAHDACVFMTWHPNPDDEVDLDKIEDYVIAPSYEALDQHFRDQMLLTQSKED